ncbi:unnamed protein product [Sphagnum balticum]
MMGTSRWFRVNIWGWCIDVLVPSLIVAKDVLLDLFDVYFGHPRVCVNDRQKHLTRVNPVGPENGLQVLSTPRHVGGLALLLEVSEDVMSVAHQLEPSPELLDEFLCLDLRVLLVRLHRQGRRGICGKPCGGWPGAPEFSASKSGSSL